MADLEPCDGSLAEQGLQARDDDPRRPSHFVGPLPAGGFDDQQPALEPDVRIALHRRSDGHAPGEIDLARRQRRASYDIDQGPRDRLLERLHQRILCAQSEIRHLKCR